MSDFALRPYKPDDKDEVAFIFHYLLRTFRRDGKHSGDTDLHSYQDGHHRLIESLLARGAKITVATPPDDDFLIYGFMLHEPLILHYVFTREQYRQLGVAMALMESTPLRAKLYTHMTRSWNHLQRRLWPMSFSPYMLFWGLDTKAWAEEQAKKQVVQERRKLTEVRQGARHE